MTRPRSSLIAIDDTPWYHCGSRCVRRAFLCGEDPFSGRSYEHRRTWIAERIKQLAEVFAIDVAGYAAMRERGDDRHRERERQHGSIRAP